MSQHIGPRTISAIGGSVKRVGNYRVHTFPSELVTDGLVLNLDAGDPRSYPSSGATWTDLSRNGNNGTLVGPTYSNADGGSLVFDGTDDYITTNYIFPTGNLPKSFSVWFKINSTTDRGWIVAGGSDTNSQAFGLFRGGGAGEDLLFHGNGAAFDMTFNVAQNTTDWYNVTISYDGSVVSGYVNGQLDVTKSVALATSSATVHLGRRKNASDPFAGNISAFQVYNRALSAAEVAQNYDALRVRYGTYTNTFTPICGGGEGKVEVLCVAGGGGGAVGGGGAGGLIYNSAFSVNSNSAISLSVGAGGRGAPTWGNTGLSGSNSTFSTITSIGGGFGGHGSSAVSADPGGSGGGAGYAGTERAAGTAGQGNAGGAGGGGAPYYPGGGGGGAGSVGADAVGTTIAGNGGSGLSYSISGTSQFYAGGGGGMTQGGGGTGGIGGSGVGSSGVSGSGFSLNAIPNTGSGGGGGRESNAGNGSNGIVIVRYPATDYNVEVLVVGGGGGGGKCGASGSDPGGGGGGAGGLIYNSSYPVSSGKKLKISVGKGGRGTSVRNNPTTENGSNSIFNDLVAIGGGKGGGVNSSGSNGGSGGGGGGNTGSTSLGTPGQGNNGYGADSNYGGGGGGAGSSGTLPTGGDGLAYSITGTSTYYAGGGAGGSRLGYATGIGGIGGGGNGGAGDNNATNGTVNTGGGGGGSSVGVSGDGGSGIVIIAYKGPQRGIGGTIDTTSRPGYTLHKFTTTGTDFFIP